MKHGLYLRLFDLRLIEGLIEDAINGDEGIYNDTHLEDVEKLQQTILKAIGNCEELVND